VVEAGCLAQARALDGARDLAGQWWWHDDDGVRGAYLV